MLPLPPIRHGSLAQRRRIPSLRALPIAPLSAHLSSELSCSLVHPSPPRAETVADSRSGDQTGHGEALLSGSGLPRREFLHAGDLADACVFLMNSYDENMHTNVGTGEDLSIAELAEMIKRVVHPSATIVYDRSKPDDAPRRLLDVSRLDKRYRISLGDGTEHTYNWLLENHATPRGVPV
ncbi:MAG: NAD-dependent epimerase/dehydratase family protein [Cyanobacteria bacterium]|nr:NAD-dependent epimerase/dehydratase family protein [Cyanobacteriota bacterium]